MQGKILIIEDERELGELIKLYLEKDGFSVIHTETAESGMELLAAGHFDLIILDINLPCMDGFEFLQEARGNFQVPVIIASARESDEDIILGLGSGADEFIVKPFSPKVLTARVRAFLRRVRKQASVTNERIFHLGDLAIYLDRYHVESNDGKIQFSSREFEVFAFLIQNKNAVLSMEEIYKGVWGNIYGDTSAVAVYIQRIRKKIEQNPAEPRIIETIYGKGYRLNG